MDDLSRIALDFAYSAGAASVGIATTETLAGGPESSGLAYIMEGSRSAVCFALPLRQDFIEPYLAKTDHASHNRDNLDTTNLASGIAFQLAKYLELKGHPSTAVAANNVYRTDTPGGMLDEMPDLSHRYLAVRSGVGWFGLSGNVIHPEFGAALVLGAVVTSAELTPTDPLPPEQNYCDQCKICLAGCAAGFMDDQQVTTVTMGGVEFSYSQRRSYRRCDYVCGGFAGLHSSGKWSTWSPSRYPIPDTDEGFLLAFRPAAKAYFSRPERKHGFYNPNMPVGKLEFTCGHCMLICHPDKEVRKHRLKLLKQSGVVIQDPDGSTRAVSPDEAKAHLAAMPPEQRFLYEPVS